MEQVVLPWCSQILGDGDDCEHLHLGEQLIVICRTLWVYDVQNKYQSL